MSRPFPEHISLHASQLIIECTADCVIMFSPDHLHHHIPSDIRISAHIFDGSVFHGLHAQHISLPMWKLHIIKQCRLMADGCSMDGCFMPIIESSRAWFKCFIAGLAYYAVQFGGQCYGGNDLKLATSLGTATCTVRCIADISQICGGPWANSLYTLLSEFA